MRTPKTLGIVLFLLFTTSLTYAQKSGLINSGQLMQQGYKFHQEGKYKQALATYGQISRSDTNYHKALHEMSVSAFADSNFSESLRYAELGLKLFPAEENDWLNLMANAYDEMGDKEKAVATYDRIVATDRNNFQAYYNKGVTLARMEKRDEAKVALQQCLLINPFYTSAHHLLGAIAYDEGRLPEAMMSYATGLMIDPSHRYFNKAILGLNSISRVTDEVLEAAQKRKPSRTDNFDLVQEILINKISLDRKYKLKASLEDPIVRQMQVMLEKIEYNASDNGFWMQFYVPLYAQIFSENRFEPFVYHIFSNVDIKPVATYVKKNEKPIGNFKAVALEYFNTIKATQQLNLAKRSQVRLRYHYNNNRLLGVGEIETRGKETVLTGPWEFYHSNGKLQAKGKFNDQSQRVGPWEFYYRNGKLKEKTSYIEGKPHGKSLDWFDNGTLSMDSEFKNGDLNGTFKQYYFNGTLRKTEQFREGKRNGPSQGYTPAGFLQYTATYRDGKETGDVTYYHRNGNVHYVKKFVDGEATGKYKEYYYDGKLKAEGMLEKNKKTGVWKEYHPNGKVLNEANYVDGEIEGEFKQFFETGTLQIRFAYKKGKLDGTVEEYDADGKLYNESFYEKGRLKDLKFFDKAGNIISSATSRKGAANLVYYDPYGNKTSEAYFTKDGLRHGKATYYHRDGSVSTVAEYKDGELHGPKTDYFINGNKSFEGNYKDDVEHGYSIRYHVNGKVRSEGWVIEGSKQGEHVALTDLGDLYSKTYYVNDDENGYTEYYHPNGKLYYEQLFEEGWIVKINQFDSNGKLVSEVDLKDGNSDFEFRRSDGSPFIKARYEKHYLHGEYKMLFPDGTPSSISYYRFGYRDSIYRSYHFGGKLASEGRYVLGSKHGEWKTYYEDGKLHQQEFFENGSQEKEFIIYNEDGTKDKEGSYLGNELHGPYRIYGDNNQLAVQLNYEKGKLISYTYEGKDGNLVAPVMIKNGTGDVVAYYKNGTKSTEMKFVDDDGHGIRKFYYTNGKVYVDGSRSDGYEHGPKKVYYPSGQLAKDATFYYGSYHGTITEFYPNGKKKSEENYHNGEKHGECRYYDANGKAKVFTYFYGVMQTAK